MGYNSGDIIKNVNLEFSKLWTALNNELSKRVKTGDEGSSTNQYTAYNIAKEQAHPETLNSSITSNPYALYILNIVKNSHLAGASNLPAKEVGDIIPNLTAYYTVVNNAAAATENTAKGGCDGACTGYCVSGCVDSAKGATAKGDKIYSGGCSNCNSICITTCTGWCYNQCTAQCVSGCLNACSAACSSTCTSNCATECGNSCYTVCKGGCGSGCTGGCGSGCTGACYSTCTGGTGLIS